MKKCAFIAMIAGCMSMMAFANDNHLSAKPDLAHHHDHDHSHADDWNYEYPELWGDLEVNKLCNAGQEQSPINITRVSPPTDGSTQLSLIESYKPQDFVVKNNGHTIVFDVAGQRNSKLYINGVPYQLLQFHYHVPSEHTVMSAHYPLEIHFVHQNEQGLLAVVGVLVNAGKYNAHFNQIITGLPNQNGNGILRDFDIDALLPKDSSVYAYKGSLTTPPCTERVQWLLKTTPIQADSKQLGVLSKLYNGNARPIQPQGNREVSLVK